MEQKAISSRALAKGTVSGVEKGGKRGLRSELVLEQMSKDTWVDGLGGCCLEKRTYFSVIRERECFNILVKVHKTRANDICSGCGQLDVLGITRIAANLFESLK